jgi:hypothetical protein
MHARSPSIPEAADQCLPVELPGIELVSLCELFAGSEGFAQSKVCESMPNDLGRHRKVLTPSTAILRQHKRR